MGWERQQGCAAVLVSPVPAPGKGLAASFLQDSMEGGGGLNTWRIRGNFCRQECFIFLLLNSLGGNSFARFIFLSLSCKLQGFEI